MADNEKNEQAQGEQQTESQSSGSGTKKIMLVGIIVVAGAALIGLSGFAAYKAVGSKGEGLMESKDAESKLSEGKLLEESSININHLKHNDDQTPDSYV